MDAVFDIAMECRSSPNPDIRNLLAKTFQSADPDVLHMIRGTIAAMDGDLDKAIFHLRTAEPSGKTLPVIYNNLASAISSKPGVDQLEALRLVELAIRADANQAYFKETRGQILAKLDRHDEAIRDLEAAMVLFNRVGIAPRAGKIHRTKVTDSQPGHQSYSAAPILLSTKTQARHGLCDK